MTSKPYLVVLGIVALVTPGHSLRAQGLDLDVTVIQSFTSVEPLSSPTGFRVGVHVPDVWRRFGVRAGFSSAREGGGEISGYCELFCVPGPFASSYYLRSLALGVSYAVPSRSWAELSLGLSASYTWQYQRLRHLDTGAVSRRGSVGPDLGLGVNGDLRFRPLVAGLRPVAHVQIDRVGATPCVADGTCFGGRTVAAVGVGLGWHFK